MIRRAEPLTDAVTFGFPSNVRRRYDCLTRFPKNYLVLGDALCSFNPLYGQGMSVATLEGAALGAILEHSESCDDLWRPFFKEAGRIIASPWMIAVGADFAFEGVTGAKPAGTDLVNRYIGKVHKAASIDPTLCRTFFDVSNLLAEPASLFHPAAMARVAKAMPASRRRRRSAYASPPRRYRGSPSRRDALIAAQRATAAGFRAPGQTVILTGCARGAARSR